MVVLKGEFTTISLGVGVFEANPVLTPAPGALPFYLAASGPAELIELLKRGRGPWAVVRDPVETLWLAKGKKGLVSDQYLTSLGVNLRVEFE